jgi:hypothetical protein
MHGSTVQGGGKWRGSFDRPAINAIFSRHDRVDSLPERGVCVEKFSWPGAARKIDRERRPVGLRIRAIHLPSAF